MSNQINTQTNYPTFKRNKENSGGSYSENLYAISISFLNILLFQCALISLITPSIAVDRNNFKTCEQSGFCKLQRALAEGSSLYELILSTVTKDGDGKVVGELVLPGKKDEKLLLEVWGLKDNSFRILLNEPNSLHSRYEVKDALVSSPIPVPVALEVGPETAVVKLGDMSKAILYAKPFRIDLVGSTGEPLISLNSKGKLFWEHYRKKEETKVEEAKTETEEQKDEAEVSQDMGEAGAHDEKGITESWKSHVDSRPNGPSSVGLDISFQGFEHVYGIPEHADTFSLKSTTSTDPYRLYNLDVFEYELNDPMALYGSIPYMLAHNIQDGTVGVYLNNAAEMWVDITNSVTDKGVMSKIYDMVTSSNGDKQRPDVDTHWMAETGLLDLFIFMGPTAKDVFRQYSHITGTTPLPQSFAIAYHQCRWNYNDQDDVLGVNSNFDKFDIPVDVIWLDIEHTNGKRYFTWDAQKFPNSVDMINQVAAKGRKMVTIIDPHIKRDDSYNIYHEAKAKDLFIKNKNGNEYDGWCWPGSSAYLDFSNPETWNWWADNFHLDKYVGSTLDLFTWNDMNEPSVFNGPEVTMEKDAIHKNGVEHREIHNLYGFYFTSATAEGQVRRSNGRLRHFVLSRAFFAGSQRSGAVWTGDNMAEWSHLQMSIPMLLSIGVAGVTFVGADVGGFFKNPDAELQTRWYQAGAYQPFFRAHAHIDTKRREPWLLPHKNMLIVRDAIRRRYALLPYWYTLFREAAETGTPLMRPLWVVFPKDPAGFAVQDEYMLGDALLVHPVTAPGATSVNVYFPGTASNIWYDVKTGQSVSQGGSTLAINVGLDSIPVYQRSGTIVPYRNRIRRASSLMKNDPFTLVVASDSITGSASGSLYLDDGETFDYKRGQFLLRSFSLVNGLFKSESADNEGVFVTSAWIEKITVLGQPSAPKTATLKLSTGSTTLQTDYDAHTKVLTIRKPGVNVAMDFTILIQ